MDLTIGEALWSCYAHGYAPATTQWIVSKASSSGASSDTSSSIAPLPNAIRALLNSHNEHRQRNLERALIQVAKGGFYAHTSRRSAVPMAGELTEALDALAQELKISTLFDGDLTEIEPDEAGAIVADVLNNVAFELEVCAVKDRTCRACYDVVTGRTTVTVTAVVNREIDQLATVMDPRNWKVCSAAFQETLPVIDTGNGQSKLGDRYVEDTTVPPSGHAWSGLLYERVVAGPHIYVNVLDINFNGVPSTTNPIELRVDYSLKDGIEPTYGAMTRNFGHLLAKKDGIRTSFEIVKTVRFADFMPGSDPWDVGNLPNFYAPAVMCFWMDDQIYNGPCCTPP